MEGPWRVGFNVTWAGLSWATGVVPVVDLERLVAWPALRLIPLPNRPINGKTVDGVRGGALRSVPNKRGPDRFLEAIDRGKKRVLKRGRVSRFDGSGRVEDDLDQGTWVEHTDARLAGFYRKLKGSMPLRELRDALAVSPWLLVEPVLAEAVRERVGHDTCEVASLLAAVHAAKGPGRGRPAVATAAVLEPVSAQVFTALRLRRLRAPRGLWEIGFGHRRGDVSGWADRARAARVAHGLHTVIVRCAPPFALDSLREGLEPLDLPSRRAVILARGLAQLQPGEVPADLVQRVEAALLAGLEAWCASDRNPLARAGLPLTHPS